MDPAAFKTPIRISRWMAPTPRSGSSIGWDFGELLRTGNPGNTSSSQRSFALKFAGVLISALCWMHYAIRNFCQSTGAVKIQRSCASQVKETKGFMLLIALFSNSSAVGKRHFCGVTSVTCLYIFVKYIGYSVTPCPKKGVTAVLCVLQVLRKVLHDLFLFYMTYPVNNTNNTCNTMFWYSSISRGGNCVVFSNYSLNDWRTPERLKFKVIREGI